MTVKSRVTFIGGPKMLHLRFDEPHRSIRDLGKGLKWAGSGSF